MRYLIIFSIVSLLHTQYLSDYSLNRSTNGVNEGLPSNGIIDIRKGANDRFYIGTGGGLGYVDLLDFDSPSFYTIVNDSLPIGGNPSMKTYCKDNTYTTYTSCSIVDDELMIEDELMIIVSGVISEFADGQNRPKGTGISWSADNGDSWRFMPQSVEPKESLQYIDLEWGGQTFDQLSVTTEINNVSYDLSLQGEFIYTTSWAGGLRRFKYTDAVPQWEVIPLPMDNQDSLYCGLIDTIEYHINPIDPPDGFHNHKAFSIFSDNDTLWVGTANGINKGIINEDNCIDWIHYTSDNGLGGWWVVGIMPQELNNFTRIWAITWDSEPPSAHKLTFTDDGGETWKTRSQLEEMDLITYNLYFSEASIYAATSNGLYKSNGSGNYWEKMIIHVDNQGEINLSDEVYSVISLDNSLLVGTADGLALTHNDGVTWDIIRFWEHAQNSNKDELRFSVYPNPFYIDDMNTLRGDGHVRFIFHSGLINSATIDIFDFAMERVNRLSNPHFIDEEGEIIWDGRNQLGDQVVNGVYFCRLTLGNNIYWTKLIVVNSQ